MPCIATCNRNRAGPPAVRRAAPHVPRSRVPVGARVRRWAAHALAPPEVDRRSNSFLPCSPPARLPARQLRGASQRPATPRLAGAPAAREPSCGAPRGPRGPSPRGATQAADGRLRPAPAGSGRLRRAPSGPGGPAGAQRAGRSRPEPAGAGRSRSEHDVLGTGPVQAAREGLTGPRLLASTGHRRVFVLAPTPVSLSSVW